MNPDEYNYDDERGAWSRKNQVELTDFMGLGRIMKELAEYRRQWEKDHPMPPLPPKKHFVEGRKGKASGKRPSHLPPPDWKDQS